MLKDKTATNDAIVDTVDNYHHHTNDYQIPTPTTIVNDNITTATISTTTRTNDFLLSLSHSSNDLQTIRTTDTSSSRNNSNANINTSIESNFDNTNTYTNTNFTVRTSTIVPDSPPNSNTSEYSSFNTTTTTNSSSNLTDSNTNTSFANSWMMKYCIQLIAIRKRIVLKYIEPVLLRVLGQDYDDNDDYYSTSSSTTTSSNTSKRRRRRRKHSTINYNNIIDVFNNTNYIHDTTNNMTVPYNYNTIFLDINTRYTMKQQQEQQRRSINGGGRYDIVNNVNSKGQQQYPQSTAGSHSIKMEEQQQHHHYYHRRLNFLPSYVTTTQTTNPLFGGGEQSLTFSALSMLFLTLSCVFCVFLSCFYHNQKTSPLFISPRRHRLPKLVPPPLPVDGYIKWVKVCFYLNDEEIINRIGYDSLIFIRFHRLALRCIVKMSVFSFIVLLPLNYTGGGHANAVDIKEYVDSILFTDFLRFSMANVKAGSPRLWVHCFAAYLLTAIVIRELLIEYENFNNIRHRYLLSREPHLRTVLVTNIPRHLRSVSKITNYFKHVYPDAVKQVFLCQNLISLETLIATRTSVLHKLERELLLLCRSEKKKLLYAHKSLWTKSISKFDQWKEDILWSSNNNSPSSSPTSNYHNTSNNNNVSTTNLSQSSSSVQFSCIRWILCCPAVVVKPLVGRQERLTQLYAQLEELNDSIEKEQRRRYRVMKILDRMDASQDVKLNDIDYVLATPFVTERNKHTLISTNNNTKKNSSSSKNSNNNNSTRSIPGTSTSYQPPTSSTTSTSQITNAAVPSTTSRQIPESIPEGNETLGDTTGTSTEMAVAVATAGTTIIPEDAMIPSNTTASDIANRLRSRSPTVATNNGAAATTATIATARISEHDGIMKGNDNVNAATADNKIDIDPNKKKKSSSTLTSSRKTFAKARRAIRRYVRLKQDHHHNILATPINTTSNTNKVDGVHIIEDHINEVTDKAFVVMRTYTAATIAIQSMHSSKPGSMQVSTAPEPRDILWENIYMSKGARRTRSYLAEFFVLVLITFYMIPVAIIALLVSEQALVSSSPRLAQLAQASAFFSAAIALVQPLGVVALQQLLPPLFIAIGRLEGMTSFSEVQMRAFSRLFLFQVLNVFLVTTIGGLIFDAIARIVENPESAFEMLGNSLPRMSSFFITFVTIKTFLGLGFELVRTMAIIQATARYVLFPNATLRAKRSPMCALRAIDDPGWFSFHKILAQDMLVVVISVVFAVVAPLVTLPCALFCLFARIMWTHHHLYVYESVFESGGQFWPKIFRRFVFGLIIAQMTITGQFILKEARHEAYATMLLMFLTYFFLRATRARYDPTSSTLPLEVATVMDISLKQDEVIASSASTGSFDGSDFSQPRADIRHTTMTADIMNHHNIITSVSPREQDSMGGAYIGPFDPFRQAYLQPALRANPRARPEQPFPAAQLGSIDSSNNNNNNPPVLPQQQQQQSSLHYNLTTAQFHNNCNSNDSGSDGTSTYDGGTITKSGRATVRLKCMNKNDRQHINRWWNDQFDLAGPQNHLSILIGEECGTLTLSGSPNNNNISSSGNNNNHGIHIHTSFDDISHAGSSIV